MGPHFINIRGSPLEVWCTLLNLHNGKNLSNIKKRKTVFPLYVESATTDRPDASSATDNAWDNYRERIRYTATSLFTATSASSLITYVEI